MHITLFIKYYLLKHWSISSLFPFVRNQIKWNLGGGKGPLINIWFAAGWCFRLYLKYIMFMTPPCTVAGIKPSERVTMATAIGYLYIYVCVCLQIYPYTLICTHTTLNWLRWSSRISLLSFSQEQVAISKQKGWGGSSKFCMMKIFQEKPRKPINIYSVYTNTCSLQNALAITKKKPKCLQAQIQFHHQNKQYFIFTIFFF